MKYSDSVTYSVYGAYALKARYQHNMVVSQLLVLGTFAFVIGLVAIWPKERLIQIKVDPQPPKPDSTVVWLPPPPPVGHDSKPAPKHPPKENQGSIPIPVSDTVEFENSIYSRADLYEISGTDTTFDSSGIGTIDTSGQDYLNDPMIFRNLEKNPEIVKEVDPDYPRLARMAQIEGVVVVWGLVNEDGKIIETRIAKSSQSEALDLAAREALMKFTCSPGIQNGRPVKCWIAKTFRFVLD